MYLNNEIPFVRAYWRFYARVLRRPDLLGRPMLFDSGNVGDLRGGSLLLTDVSDKAKAAIAARPDIVELTSASDVNGRDSGLDGAAHQTFVVYRKR